MSIRGPGKIITVYIGSRDQWHGQSLYNAIVQRAREMGMAGATVTEGIEGYGANSKNPPRLAPRPLDRSAHQSGDRGP